MSFRRRSRIFGSAGHRRPHERLTCQAQLPAGDVLGRVPEATKLPHVRCADEVV